MKGLWSPELRDEVFEPCCLAIYPSPEGPHRSGGRGLEGERACSHFATWVSCYEPVTKWGKRWFNPKFLPEEKHIYETNRSFLLLWIHKIWSSKKERAMPFAKDSKYPHSKSIFTFSQIAKNDTQICPNGKTLYHGCPFAVQWAWETVSSTLIRASTKRGFQQFF